MTALRFIQLCCEGCAALYPVRPAVGKTAGELRAAAGGAGWEVLRHTKGRDLCPPCRIKEIKSLAAALPEAPGTGVPDGGAMAP